MKREADAGKLQLYDLGVGYQRRLLWFNLKPGAFGRRSRAPPGSSATSSAGDLARGRSQAVRGHRLPRRRRAGVWPDHAGEQGVVYARPAPDAARSREGAYACSRRSASPIATATAGSRTRAGRPARFTLAHAEGPTALERGGRGDPRRADRKSASRSTSLPLDGNAVVEQFVSGKRTTRSTSALITSDTDPAQQPRLLAVERREPHLWNIGQKTPGHGSGRREIDRADDPPDGSRATRRSEGASSPRSQKIFAEHLPMLYFAAPRMYRGHVRRA